MKALAALIIGLCDLFEAEGRLLRESVLEAWRNALILAIGILFGAGALVFFVSAAYAALMIILPKPVVLAFMGIICAAISVCLLWSMTACKRQKKTENPEEQPPAQAEMEEQPR